MRRKISCPSCGANLKPDAYYCDYCGSFFEHKQSQIEREQLDRIQGNHSEHYVDRYDTENTKPNVYENEEFKSQFEEPSYVGEQNEYMTDSEIDASWNINNSKLNVHLNYYIEQSKNPLGIIVIIISVFMFALMGPFAIIPIIIFSSVANKNKERNEKLQRLYRKGDYYKAYETLNELKKNMTSPNMLTSVTKQQIALNFYRLNNEEKAKTQLERINNYPQKPDSFINSIAKELGTEYPKIKKQY